jgi:opacity protein-like surface antigen
MMKRTILIVLSVLIVLPAFSQVKFGLKAGLSTTSIKMDDLITLTSGETEYLVDVIEGANYGFHVGAFVRFSLARFYIQPELLFTSRTDEYTATDLENPASAIIKKQQFNQLELPVMLGFKLGPVRIHGGPSARLLVNSPDDLIDSPDFETVYNSFTFGYQAGLGVDFIKRITIDLRYEGSLQKYQTQIQSVAGDDFTLDDRPSAFLLSVGFMF